MHTTDRELIQDLQKGNDEQFHFLVQRYLKKVYNFVYIYVRNESDAEDCTQEAFVKAWKNIKRFNPDKNFSPWIFQIAKNTCLDYLKKKKEYSFSHFETESFSFSETISADEISAEELFDQELLKNKIENIIRNFSPESQVVIKLYLEEGLTFQEISDVTSESINTVKSRYRRALIEIKKFAIE